MRGCNQSGLACGLVAALLGLFTSTAAVAKGDEISLTGSKVKRELEDLILVRELVKGNDTVVLRDDKASWRALLVRGTCLETQACAVQRRARPRH